MRIATAQGSRATTAAAAVASSDGRVYYVDLGRWELPSERQVHGNVVATVTLPETTDQRIVLDPATVVTVTPGYTPTVRWTVTHEGVLPGLAARRALVGRDATAPWLALQVGVDAAATEVVRLYDPTLGVLPGDTVVVEADGLGTCTEAFEVQVEDFVAPTPSTQGGAVRFAEKDPGDGAWHSCFTALTGLAQDETIDGLRATFRAGGANAYVLVHGTGAAAVHVGRPPVSPFGVPGVPFGIAWAAEASFPACVLPPSAPWPDDPALVPACDAACRAACQDLQRARLARRVGYVPESCGGDAACLARWPGDVTDVHGPAIVLALALETAATPTPARDRALVIDTKDGRTPLQAVDSAGPGVAPRAVVPFDRSALSADPTLSAETQRNAASAGVRFIVPFASDVVLDATPTRRDGVVPLR
jgi:hypothetical protein